MASRSAAWDIPQICGFSTRLPGGRELPHVGPFFREYPIGHIPRGGQPAPTVQRPRSVSISRPTEGPIWICRLSSTQGQGRQRKPARPEVWILWAGRRGALAVGGDIAV